MKKSNWKRWGIAWSFLYWLSFNTDAKPLKIGDQMPDVIIEKVINADADKIRLQDHKDDLIILHFFSIYCGTCVKELNRLDDLQHQINGLRVIPITNRGEERVVEMIKEKEWSLPFVTSGNQELFEAFPHKLISHVIWIKDMQIIAITEGKYLTHENLSGAISGEPMNLPLKQDQLDYDRMAPLLINGNGGNGETLKYQSLITGELKGISGGFTRPPNGLKSVNTSVLYLYQRVYTDLLEIDLTQNSRVIFETDEDQKKMIQNIGGNHTFCYSLTVPEPWDKKQKAEKAIAEINEYFRRFHHFEATIERRKVHALVLSRAGKKYPMVPAQNDKPLLKELDNGSVTLVSQRINALVFAIQKQMTNDRYPVLDHSSYDGTIGMTLLPWSDLNQLNAQLRMIGFEVKIKKVALEMLVFKKAQS